MDIKHVCSLGSVCHSSNILKQNKLKKCSYPFDWIFSNCDNIIHCLEDDFKIFLDKSYYQSVAHDCCSHSKYAYKMFMHRNPLINENDYNYYVRCVNRFRVLLQSEEQKLFTMIYVNMDTFEETLKNSVIELNKTLSKYTNNYKLLFILHIQNKPTNYHKFTHHENIDFLELHTLSTSSGTQFYNNNDNLYLNNIINTTYSFNVELKT